MFKKLLNVGKGHSNDKLQQQLQQQQQKNLFQFNEIKSYGFSKFTCLAYSPTLSLLAAGSSFGQLSVFGGPTVEFTYHLASSSDNGIRHIEFIDCRPAIGYQAPKSTLDKQAQQKDDTSVPSISVPAKLIVLTNTSHLHLFELRTCEPQNFADGTTQTDSSHQQQDCCSQQVSHPTDNGKPPQTVGEDKAASLRFTKLVHVGKIDYFKFKLGEDEDKSKRVTTIEICADNTSFLVGTESGNLYQVPLSKFEMFEETKKQQVAKHQAESANQQQQPSDLGTSNATSHPPSVATAKNDQQLTSNKDDAEETTAVNLNDEPQIGLNDDGDQASIANEELFDIIKYEDQIAAMLGDEIKPKKQGAIESIRRHPLSSDKILISYHRGLNVIYNLSNGTLEKYFYHNETIECSCFADQLGDFFYTSHTDGSYVRWDTRATGNQATANEESVAQLYGPYPCKPTPKIQACTGLVNDQLEDLIIFSGGMPRATYDDKHPVTIVHAGADGKDTIKKVLDFSSKVLDFVIITRPRGQLGAGAKSTGNTNLGSSAGATGGKKNKNKQQKEQAQLQQQQQRPIAVALAVLAEEEFVVIDLLNSESYLEFALPYLNCVHSSAITCSEHCSNVSGELYDQLLAYNKRESKGRLSPNGWPVTGGKVIDLQQTLIQPGDETGNAKAHDLLITGHEDGSINIWDVTELSMRHLIYLQTSRYFAVNEDDDLAMVDGGDSLANKPDHSGASAEDSSQHQQDASPNDNSTSDPSNGAETAWPPLKRVGRFDPFSDDTRLAVRKVRLCPQTGTLVIAGTGGK